MFMNKQNNQKMEWVPCVLCGSHLAVTHLGIQRLARCLDCGMIFINPRPISFQIHSQYNENYFHCETPIRGGYENYIGDEKEIRLTFRRRIKRLQRLISLKPESNVLDIGCAAGFFLQECKYTGWDVHGLELCEFQAQEARNKGLHVVTSSIEKVVFEDSSFDLITMWDVIEHLPEPVSALKSVYRWLKPGGHVVLSTPDTDSWMATIFRRNWLGFRSVDEHLFFFNRTTINRALKLAGLTPERFTYTGKYLNLPRIITRLRYYSRIGTILLRFSETRLPSRSIYLNPLDTMMVAGQKRS